MNFVTDTISYLSTKDGFWVTALYKGQPQTAIEQMDELDGMLDVEIKKHREKRSLNANAYCWVLIDKLAEKMNMPQSIIYRNIIREIGGVSDTVMVSSEAAAELKEKWEHKGLGWQVEQLENVMPGFAVLKLYYGSSTYDTAQMARLIDLIIQECEIQGIQTLTPDEIANLKSLWDKTKHD